MHAVQPPDLPSPEEVAVAVGATGVIGSVLVAWNFLPLLPRNGRSVFASISARVGSIEDIGTADGIRIAGRRPH
jgi:hypothetical protein